MIDDLRAIAIFAETARQGSFRAASKILGLSPSVVSYHITQLEERVGTALIYRSTRKLSLTHEGEILYQHALEMIASAQQGLNGITSDDDEPTGRLTITMPAALIRSPINQQIAMFSQQCPKIELHIIYAETREDLIAKGIDLAIRAGHMEDSALKSKRIGQVKRKLVCSAEYWSKRQEPSHPQELCSWKWVRLRMLPSYRTLIKAGMKPVRVEFESNICVDSVDAMAQLSLLGLGLSSPPDYLVDDLIEQGQLIELFPDWTIEPVPVYAVWPGNVSDNRNTRRLLNFLKESESTD